MDINVNTWYIKFYLFLHNYRSYQTSKLPDNICDLRTELVKTGFLLLLIGPAWIIFAAILNWMASYDETKPWVVAIINAMLFVVGMAIAAPSHDSPGLFDLTLINISYVWYFFPIIISGLATIGFLGMMRLFDLLERGYRTVFPKKVPTSKLKTPGPIKVMYQSWRDKYCTPINWKK